MLWIHNIINVPLEIVARRGLLLTQEAHSWLKVMSRSALHDVHICCVSLATELPKTKEEFEEKLIFKSFFLKSMNAFAPIFYVAFFKGRCVSVLKSHWARLSLFAFYHGTCFSLHLGLVGGLAITFMSLETTAWRRFA